MCSRSHELQHIDDQNRILKAISSTVLFSLSRERLFSRFSLSMSHSSRSMRHKRRDGFAKNENKNRFLRHDETQQESKFNESLQPASPTSNSYLHLTHRLPFRFLFETRLVSSNISRSTDAAKPLVIMLVASPSIIYAECNHNREMLSISCPARKVKETEKPSIND